ncbi:MAG: hypothetical protein LC748_06875, partial [Thermomicrobia bacterium]|nr:hypothetical protein [Thermomicrobia bacterium]
VIIIGRRRIPAARYELVVRTMAHQPSDISGFISLADIRDLFASDDVPEIELEDGRRAPFAAEWGRLSSTCMCSRLRGRTLGG